jgi:segregation and condensation protein A
VHDDAAYRVELDQFSGPMDLLLHLLREDEVDVERIPVARVCDRFLTYLDDLDRIDIDVAGDFLVMASTLMRMKSRSLLPKEEQVLEDDDLDPRFELVRQLIQYRRFKQVAGVLDERRESAARCLSRGAHPESNENSDHRPEISVDGASVELLFAAFARLLKETSGGRPYVVTVDDTPIEEHIARVEALVPLDVRLDFRQLLPQGASRAYVIGVFLALLELLKRGRISVRQDTQDDEIEVVGADPAVRRAMLDEAEARSEAIDQARSSVMSDAPPDAPSPAGTPALSEKSSPPETSGGGPVG